MNLWFRARIFAVILALMAVTGLCIKLVRPVRVETEPPAGELPAIAGNWTGHQVMFCQGDQCGRAWTPDQVEARGEDRRCPVCREKVDLWSLGERRSLPADTLLFRRQYTNFTGGTLTMTLVVSPPNVNSIHRPQTCIFGQGYRIVKAEELVIPIPRRPAFRLTLLELSRLAKGAGGGAYEIRSFLSYWFMDRTRQTPSHEELTFDLARDRLIYGKVCRWAYVSVTSEWNVSKIEYQTQLMDLVQSVLPLLESGVDH